MPTGHSSMGGPRGYGGGGWRGGARPMPPVAGVIHERAGGRPFYSSYGHANTGYGGGFRYGMRGYEPTGGGLRYGRGYSPSGYGHVATGFRGGGFGRTGGARFADGRRFGRYRFGRFYGGFGGYGGGYAGGGGGYDDGAGAYGGSGGAYGAAGPYGSYGTQAGNGGAYLSEPPLAATRTEAPLAPSPYGPDGGYYAPERAGISPHILTVDRSARSGCDCRSGASAYPVIYRYGVGTAY